jgi:hypothetical protein
MIPVLNGKIEISFVKQLFTADRKYERRLFLHCQTDREWADLSLSREQVEELVKQLNNILLENPK